MSRLDSQGHRQRQAPESGRVRDRPSMIQSSTHPISSQFDRVRSPILLCPEGRVSNPPPDISQVLHDQEVTGRQV